MDGGVLRGGVVGLTWLEDGHMMIGCSHGHGLRKLLVCV